MEWKNIYRGLLIGASDVIPGVSGGTIAVLLGIYDRLIQSINGIFSKNWRQYLNFLIPLVLGVAIAILSVARLMKWLFEHHPGLTNFFFLGLIAGIIPYLFQEAKAREFFTKKHYSLLVLGAILVSTMVLFADIDQGEIITNKTVNIYILLFISGILASAAMILPGISGSAVFYILGVYPTIIDAITTFHLMTMLIVGAGIAIGIVTMSKIIHYFLQNYRTNTFALIIGGVIGSIVVIFPGWPGTTPTLIASIMATAAGLFLAYILGRVEYE